MPSVPTLRGLLTSPRYTGQRPATMRAMDVLPAPFGPEMSRCSPGWTINESDSISSSPPCGKIEGATIGTARSRSQLISSVCDCLS